jgi:squalene-associated FAD-dependent desaturase
MKRAVVVGGGLAGCAAAVRLAERGWSVTLLERHPRLGGKLASFRHRGRWVDNGTHVATKACTAFRGFLETLGVAGALRWQERLRIPFLAPGGKRHLLTRWDLPAPLHLLPGLIAFDLIPAGERLGLKRVLDAAKAKQQEGESALTFLAWLLELGQGERAIRRFWDPLVYAICNAGSGEIGADAGAWVVREALCTRPDALDLGLFTVPQAGLLEPAVLHYLEPRSGRGGGVRTGAEVAALTGTGSRISGVRLRTGEEIPAEVVVLAAPWEAAHALLPERFQTGAAWKALAPGAILSVTLVLDRPVLPEGEDFVALVDTPVQWAFSKTRLWGLDPKEEVLSLVVSGAHVLVDRDREDLVALAKQSLETCLPGMASARILDAVVMKEKRATFLPAPGSDRLRPGPTFPGLEGLALAGAWTATGWPATLEGAVRSGQAAAEALLTGGV